MKILAFIGLIFLFPLMIGIVNPQPSIKDAREYAEKTLLPIEGIAGISHRENPPTIVVYVEHEKYIDKVPSKIMGFPVEVVVTGKIKALSFLQQEVMYTYSENVSRTSVVRPIVGGISIGVPESAFGTKMAGTLGVVTANGYILTCAHVIAMDKNAKFLPLGTPVIQPGSYDGGTDSNEVGKLYKYIKITFGGKSITSPNYADAAIATIDQGISYLTAEELGSDNKNTYSISGTTEVSIGDTVRKSGRSTEVTYSTVNDTSATVKVYYTSTKWAVFKDQILVNQPFIQAGDSGSLVDKDGKFVGLAFAGSDTIAVVCKAKYIISGLGVEL